METQKPTIDIISKIFCVATKKVIETATKTNIVCIPTIQKIPKVSIRPSIGCFVQFSGDYNGLTVMNFSDRAAMTIYKNYMLNMGISEKELVSSYTSSDVPDSIGELTNQVMGQGLSMVEDKFMLSSFCGQPKALALNSAITLTIDSSYINNRRMAFVIDGNKFYLELSMESTEFIVL